MSWKLYLSARIGDAEIDTRAWLGKASSVYQRSRPVWTSNAINTSTKLHLYKPVVISAAIYAADTWKGASKKFPHMWDIFTAVACALYWAFHGEITLPMTSWWRGLGCRTCRVLSKWHDTGRAYTTASTSNRPASVAMQWVPNGGKRRRGRPNKTWRQILPGRFAGDESQLEWCSQSGQWSESVEKPRCPILQQEWDDDK